jgi:hypothetical protein
MQDNDSSSVNSLFIGRMVRFHQKKANLTQLELAILKSYPDPCS